MEKFLEFFVMLIYYMSASRGLPISTNIFFENTKPNEFGFVLWFAVAALNALVWSVAWNKDDNKKGIGVVITLSVLIIPPIGLVSWTNPILPVSALYFPALGVFGIALGFTVLFLLASKKYFLLIPLFATSSAANLCYVIYPENVNSSLISWSAENTSFSKLQSNGNRDLISDGERFMFVLRKAKELNAGRTLILPETILPSKNSSQFGWKLIKTADSILKEKNSRIIVGTEDDTDQSNIKNMLTVIGLDNQGEMSNMIQRVPVPIGMYRPFDKTSYQINIFDSGVKTSVNNININYLICYEQLLIFPELISMMDSPDIIIGSANDWWSKDSSIPAIQNQMLYMFGLLINKPVFSLSRIPIP
jgi:hypothetical protein